MKKFILIIGLVQLLIYASFGQNIPERASPPVLVNDLLNILTTDQKNALEQKLVAYDKKTSTQIAILTTDNIGELGINDFGTEVLRKWGIGNKGKDNGVVLIIYKSTDGTKRKVGISTGYGLESTLTDYTSKAIIDNEIIPLFKGQNFYGGLNNGTDAIIKATEGAYTAPDNYNKGKTSLPGWLAIAIFIGALVFIIWASKNGGNNGGYMSRRGHSGWQGPVIFPSSGGGGGWFDGGGSGGGGGFGGFGGGGGGGGGASGDW